MPADPISEETEAAFRFRHKAEEIRMIAEDTRDNKLRNVLVAVADDYEKMAQTMERIAAEEKSRSAHQTRTR